MTTATAVPARHRVGADDFAGVGSLVRFILRRDRIRIPVWLAALTIGTVSTASSFEGLYPTEADRQVTIETMNTPAGIAMTGPVRYLEDYNFGSMMGHQMLGFVAVLVGIMSVLLVVRHTRAEEESNRAELLRATIVGRFAHLSAALLVAIGVNLVLAVILTLGLALPGTPGITWGGSLLYGLAHAAVGIVFAATAAVTVQITEHSRGASGMAFAAVGAAYVLRAAGDIDAEALSWLSPIGWAQRTYVFVDNHWWPLLLCLALSAALAAIAFRLSTRRDLGAGLRATRPGATAASTALTHPLGFALRVHRGMLIGFAAAMGLVGVMYGSILGEADDMLAGIEAVEEVIADIGGASPAESWASLVMVIIAIISSVYVVLATLRPQAEESTGRAEPVLGTALSRSRWLGSHLTVALLGGAAVLFTAGLAFGILGALSTGDAAILPRLATASLAYVPALWVTAGVAILLFGIAPRATAAAWILPVYAFVVGYLGEILQFPGWMNDLSPFSYIPQVPSEEMAWTPFAVLLAIAALLVAGGVAGFRRRDLVTN